MVATNVVYNSVIKSISNSMPTLVSSYWYLYWYLKINTYPCLRWVFTPPQTYMFGLSGMSMIQKASTTAAVLKSDYFTCKGVNLSSHPYSSPSHHHYIPLSPSHHHPPIIILPSSHTIITSLSTHYHTPLSPFCHHSSIIPSIASHHPIHHIHVHPHPSHISSPFHHPIHHIPSSPSMIPSITYHPSPSMIPSITLPSFLVLILSCQCCPFHPTFPHPSPSQFYCLHIYHHFITDLPCLCSLMDDGKMLVHSLPGLKPLMESTFAPLHDPRYEV